MPQHPCDTHILAARGHALWLRQALDSLVGEPTHVHLIEGGSPGNIGAGRARAFRLGTAPYVACLDDDDTLLPGVMAQCIAYLDRHPACVGAYTDRRCLFTDGTITERRTGPWDPRRQLCDAGIVTHLTVMRRALVEQYLDELPRWPTHDDYVLHGLLAAHGPWHHLSLLGAVKRERRPGESLQPTDSTRLSTPGLWQRAVARVAPVLLAIDRPVSG
ncbi:glycosyltransferase [uncultured Lamprocystis sp.]|jgi:hypothetical protein|uniref:glycosyltransferase n=1 Tax=uncultured Lamprocystis sp. TaxID=543132 RepID=UPI0025EA6A0F|nr:glycosyltransferase [uncultured Lamprocystis sp.]